LCSPWQRARGPMKAGQHEVRPYPLFCAESLKPI
jgi:hypothetical protein